MRLLLVNTVASGGSIGAYLARISRRALSLGHEVVIASGYRPPDTPGVEHIAIGSRMDRLIQGAATRLFDMHGRTGASATADFIEKIKAYKPDIIHLHNIHGYYLHYPSFFRWLSTAGIPVVWTLHDCWPLTGHCAFFDRAECLKWQIGCEKCPLPDEYPACLFRSSSQSNFRIKHAAFTSVPGMILLPVSNWLTGGVLRYSMLRDIKAVTVKLDVGLDMFRPAEIGIQGKIVLGAANVWNKNKNLDFFTKLRKELPADVRIRIAGNLLGQNLPEGIEYAGMIDSTESMRRLYASASVFVNPTLADNYPQTNREAIACGTPVVSRAVGGAVEDLIDGSGAVKAAVSDQELIALVRQTLDEPQAQLRVAARQLAERLYGGEPWLARLFEVYESLL